MKEYNEVKTREGYRRLTQYLIRHKKTITTMESATSGLIASLITDTEGSSAVFKGAFVTYSNEAKILQGVPEDIIMKYSVYSFETAEAMAKACKNTYHADIGIGITGTTGNVDPVNEANSVPGEVYFAFSFEGETESFYISLPEQPTRFHYKMAIAEEIINKLSEKLSL